MEPEKKESGAKAPAGLKTDTLEAQLRQWGVDLEKFKARADQAGAEARAEFDKQMAALRTRMDEAQKRLQEVKKAGGSATEEMKKGVENAWAEMRKAFGSAASKWGKESPLTKEVVEAKLKEWAFELGRLKVRAEQAGAEAKAEYDRQSTALRAKMEDLQRKMQTVAKSGSEASGEMGKGIENAWAELKKAFESATAKFK